MPNFKALNLLVAGLLWPLLVTALAWLSPGSGAVPQVESGRRNRFPAGFAPPVASQPSTTFVGTEDAEGSARIFWDEPERIKLQMVIEIPAEEVAESGGSNAAETDAVEDSGD